jgi:hypothetical protein
MSDAIIIGLIVFFSCNTWISVLFYVLPQLDRIEKAIQDSEVAV